MLHKINQSKFRRHTLYHVPELFMLVTLGELLLGLSITWQIYYFWLAKLATWSLHVYLFIESCFQYRFVSSVLLVSRYFSFLLFLFLTYILLILCSLLLYFIIFRSFSPFGSAIKVQLFFTLRFVSYSFFIFFYFICFCFIFRFSLILFHFVF